MLQRTLANVRVWPREVTIGALGSAGEGFSQPIALSASIGYVSNSLNSNLNALMSAPYGMREVQTIKLRFQKGAAISAGDGVSLPGEEMPMWRCVEVSRYPFLTVARLERIAQ